MAGIVVGVDGSPHSQAALDWALDEAALRNAHLTALAVAPAVTGYWGIFSQADSSHEEQERVNQAAKDMVEKAAQRHGHQQVAVRTVSGVPSDELLKASADADLVVVGARGGGGFARLRMGSVSTQVTAHAHCPVVVVQSGAGS
jgi:nucleotide-binding universal stress UspA family protein